MHNHKKKVALITPFYLPARLSGAEYMNFLLAKLLSNNGYEVTIITSDVYALRYWRDIFHLKRIQPKLETLNNIQVIRLRHNQFLAALYFLLSKFSITFPGPQFQLSALSILLRKTKFDYIYSAPFPYYFNFQLSKIIGSLRSKPLLIVRPDFHSEIKTYENPKLQTIFDSVSKIHILTQTEKTSIQKKFSVDEDKFHLIPNALPLSEMTSVNRLQREIKKLKDSYKLHNKTIILFAGTKIYSKGVFLIANTVAHLYKKDPRYVLMTIGTDTFEWEQYKKTIRNDYLIDLGYVSERQKEIIFASCDIFCMPSISEAFGLTYLEAWHKKKPVIGANIPAVQELILTNNGGVCVPFGNIDYLGKSIKHLINNPELMKQYGQNGYNRLVKSYNISHNIQNYLSLFR